MDQSDVHRDEATWALGRLPDRTYIHKTFPLRLPASRDYGMPARYVVKVFDDPLDAESPGDGDLEWEEHVVQRTPAGRRQIKLQIAREAGQVRQLELERVVVAGGEATVESLLTLDRDGAGRLIDLIRALDHIPVDGTETTVRIDDRTLTDLLTDPEASIRLYQSDPQRFRKLIESDASADDVVALEHRKQVVREFRELLRSEEYFEEARARHGGGREVVWQRFLEENPWILGVSLAGQLLTSWSDNKLEQVVAGFSVAGPGKRADAVLRTSGRIRSLVFAEIKHHETDLLGSEYRPGCWPASADLVGGVTQVQQTVDLAVRQIGQRLADVDGEGAETGEATWLIRPRSFLIIGDLDQLRGPGGVVRPKLQSFELYRRNLYEPEIVTFDELLARAEWHVTSAERDAGDEP